MASDYFRYHYLATSGGVYIDSAFVLGDHGRFAALSKLPLFIPSVPVVDLTPAIVQARVKLGRVLLNGMLFAKPSETQYFRILTVLIRGLVARRAAESIPFVTGIGVLSMFDFAVANPDSAGRSTVGSLIDALLPGAELYKDTVMEFLLENEDQLKAVRSCSSTDFRELSTTFIRPTPDDLRFQDEAHWSNHQSSIYQPVKGNDGLAGPRSSQVGCE